jgi:cytochrome c556
MKSSFFVALVGALITAGAFAADKATDPLPGPARRAIGQRMANHASDLNLLLNSILILDYDAVSDRATRIATAPQLTRPGAGETSTLNTTIPSHFYDLQDGMIAQAKLLAEAATHKDDVKMAKAFGQMAQNCVACHSAYLFQPPAQPAKP